MTERKPRSVPFESWIDRQIREATERGAFDDLPGAGKPIADVDRGRDENWWVRRKLEREQVAYLPPALALRRDVDEIRGKIVKARTEDEVRELVTEANALIRAALLRPAEGPPITTRRLDVEETLAEWRAARGR